MTRADGSGALPATQRVEKGGDSSDRPGEGGPAAALGAGDLQRVGQTLRGLREHRGVSQSELARRTGVRRTYVISLEKGEHEPSVRELARLATALGYALRDYLWTLAGEPFADPQAPLAARVRLRRERLGISQAALARRAGVPRATISQLETGFNRNPGLFLLGRVARALGCCPSELAHGLEASLVGEAQAVQADAG